MTDHEILEEILKRVTRTETTVEKLEARMVKTETALEQLQKHVTKVEVTQEVKVLKNLSMLAEGHELILQTLDEKITDKTDKLQDQVDVLTIAVKYQRDEIDELKAAKESA